MLKIINGILTISSFAVPNYRKLVERDKAVIIQKGTNKEPAMLLYDNIIKSKVIAHLGYDPEIAFANKSALEQFIAPNYEAQCFFANYKIDGKFLPENIQKQYTTKAVIIQAVKQYLNSSKKSVETIPAELDKLQKNIKNLIKDGKLHCEVVMPQSAVQWRRLLKAFNDKGYESLISGNLNNNNASKLKESKDSFLFTLLRKNINDSLVAETYNDYAKRQGWKQISPATVSRFRNKNKFDLTIEREGITSFRNNNSLYINRSKPTSPLYFWSMDGWTAELLYQEEYINSKNQVVTKYHNRLTVEFVLDPCCNYIIGYAIGKGEDSELHRLALQNAINHTKVLFGKRYSTWQLQSDNFGRKELQNLVSLGVAQYYTPARAKNAKAKPVEAFNAWFNSHIAATQENWSGKGITSDFGKQNSDYLNTHKKDFPSYAEICQQIDDMIMLQRAGCINEYLAKWQATTEDNRREMSDADYLYIFGERSTERKQKGGTDGRILGNNFHLDFQVDGKEYNYITTDMLFAQNPSVRWELRYDPQDMTNVLALSEDGRLKVMLQEPQRPAMAIKDQKPGDAQCRADIDKFNKELEKTLLERAEMHKQRAIAVAGRIPAYDEHLYNRASEEVEAELLQKLQITDSRNQHKINANVANNVDTLMDKIKREVLTKEQMYDRM